MEKFVILDESYLDEMAALYKAAFNGEPWNDNWSDENQLLEYVKEKAIGFHAINFGLFVDDRLVAISLGQIVCWRHDSRRIYRRRKEDYHCSYLQKLWK